MITNERGVEDHRISNTKKGRREGEKYEVRYIIDISTFGHSRRHVIHVGLHRKYIIIKLR